MQVKTREKKYQLHDFYLNLMMNEFCVRIHYVCMYVCMYVCYKLQCNFFIYILKSMVSAMKFFSLGKESWFSEIFWI